MADLDLDAIAAIETEWDGYADDAWVTLTAAERDALVAEVRRLRAIEDAAREALAQWAAWGREHERPTSVATAMHHLNAALEADR